MNFVQRIDAYNLSEQGLLHTICRFLALSPDSSSQILAVDNFDQRTNFDGYAKMFEEFFELEDQDGAGSGKIAYITNKAQTGDLSTDDAMLWHRDGAYKADSPKFGGLYCIEADPNAGATLFANQIAALAMLDEETRKILDDLTVIHSVENYAKQANYPFKYGSKAEQRYHERKRIVKKAVYKNYLNVSPGYIDVDWFTNENRKALEAAVKAATHIDHSYVHHWKPNQLVLYNNETTLHTREATAPNLRRKLLRFVPVLPK